MRPEITLIRKLDPDRRMSKWIFLDEHGALRSDGCLMVQGTGTRAPAETSAELAQLIAACAPDQAITLGTLKAELPSPVTITTERSLRDHPGAISRARRFIDYREGEPAWALIDFDAKGMPEAVSAAIAAHGMSWEALLAVAPGLGRAARVSRASTSAGLFHAATGERFAGSGGAHHYVMVKDGRDIERFLRELHDRSWLHGLGWHLVSRAGQLLERSLVDRMVGYGERLCFEGAPVVEPPLKQDAAERIPQAFEGEAIDTGLVAPKLTEYERHLVDQAKSLSAEGLGRKAAGIRAEYDRLLADQISAKTGMPTVSAQRLVAATHRGVLGPQVELDFDHLGLVPVGDVLADPDRFVDETLADPLEGADYGRCKAKVMHADDGVLFIHSFAHGRSIYYLRHDARSAKAAIAQAPTGGVVDYAMAILATAEMEPDELTDFAATVAKAAGIGKQDVKARIAKERRERELAEGKAALAARAHGRIIRPRPARDGELTPVATFLDRVLASDNREEPPMRDASGHLVEVRVQVPWNLHVLTADGTNAAAVDGEAMKAPPEPVLVQLTPTVVEMLIERYVGWEVITKKGCYFGSLARPHIDALTQFSPSAMAIARAINTTPLISMSGNVIEGVGLDRHTGLVHRIDPLLSACLPATPPTERDVKEAMTFLMNEWLVDVALSPEGKAVAIMLAMTLIERAILPERPAFFVTAGQRGGGKTTLIIMITIAVLGRRAAAAAWSWNHEERRKALFAYLRQGVACLVWDNIARGSSISCPHIEAALTAAETSDRVLGGSTVEATSATSVQIFTGNSIMPRGDMASRSLMMALNVDRPDPENRRFAHADPLAWTQANRSRIVRALYTLLVAGALSRPAGREPKTRFKTWWQLVGWPIEYAAGLLGIDVDCASLMMMGEADDEEAAATSAALTILREIWSEGPFTARDVVKAMPIESKYDVWSATISEEERARAEEEKTRAQTIADALGELVGKRLERPTAHSIGKLFQKRLVGRPTWIGDGKMVATLCREQGHAENSYRIKVTGSSGSKEVGSDASGEKSNSVGDLGPKHSPHSPHSPTPPPTTGGAGNVGKDGNVSAAAGADDAISKLPPTLPGASGSGNVGKDGNVFAVAGADDPISPDVIGVLPETEVADPEGEVAEEHDPDVEEIDL